MTPRLARPGLPALGITVVTTLALVLAVAWPGPAAAQSAGVGGACQVAAVQPAAVESVAVESAAVESADVEPADVESADVEPVDVETADVEPVNVPPAAPPVPNDPGVFDDHINFGQSAAFSGDAQALGKSMRLGLSAAFAEAGAVHGRHIRLRSLDDRYEPQGAIDNTRRLIEQDKVFALIGAVGTPTARAAVPLALEAGVPYIAPLTGTDFLRQPQWHNVVNLRASYNQETEAMVSHLVDELGLDRIGVFYQDDSFGQAGFQGAELALFRRNLQPAVTAVYPRNTRAVKSGLLDLRDARPQAVIMVGSYQPVAEIVTWANKIGFKPVFMTLSFVGGNALLEALGPRGKGVYVTQVVPPPDGDRPAVLRQYRRALQALQQRHIPEGEREQPGFVSLEGYLAGRLVAEVLRRMGPDVVVTRACFLQELQRAKALELGGFRLSFAEGNQGSDTVYLMEIDENGRYRRVGDG